MKAMATSGWGDDLPAGWESLPPAPGEANERHRAKKYDSEIQKEHQTRTKALVTSARGNKLPPDWSNSTVYMLPDRKEHVASTSGQKDTFVSYDSQLSHDHQHKRVDLSPVFQINDGGVLRPVCPIRLEDRLNPEPTNHEIGMPKTMGLHPILGLTGIDEFIPALSIQDQMRGVDASRVPDPYPNLPRYRPKYQSKKKSSFDQQAASPSPPVRAPEYKRLLRLGAKLPQEVPLDERTAAAMDTFFDFDDAAWTLD
jgi:hypothetical protein